MRSARYATVCISNGCRSRRGPRGRGSGRGSRRRIGRTSVSNETADLGDRAPRARPTRAASARNQSSSRSPAPPTSVRHSRPCPRSPRSRNARRRTPPTQSVGYIHGRLFGRAVGNVRVDQDQPGDPLGMGGCEELGDQPSVIRGATTARSLSAASSTDPEIVRECLEGRNVTRGEPLREPPAPAVRDDQASVFESRCRKRARYGLSTGGRGSRTIPEPTTHRPVPHRRPDTRAIRRRSTRTRSQAVRSCAHHPVEMLDRPSGVFA